MQREGQDTDGAGSPGILEEKEIENAGRQPATEIADQNVIPDRDTTALRPSDGDDEENAQ